MYVETRYDVEPIDDTTNAFFADFFVKNDRVITGTHNLENISPVPIQRPFLQI